MKDGFTRLALKIYRNSSEGAVSIFFVAVICLVTLTIYMPLSTHQFLTLDDPTYVTANSHVLGGLTLENIKWAFTTFHAEFWHPLTWVSLMLDTSIFGVKAGGYLFTNLLLHILNSVILFYVLRLMTGNVGASAFMALLFAVHPLHVEAVAWISERKEVLSAFFWMLSLLAYGLYAKAPSIRRYSAVILFFIAGIMSKPIIITLPFLLMLLDFWPLNRLNILSGMKRFDQRPALWLVLEKIPLLIISTAGAVVTVIAQEKGGGIVSTAVYPISSRISNGIISYVKYIENTFWPTKLAVFYPLPKTIHFSMLLGYTVLLVLISAICIMMWKKYPFFLVGWLWFVGTLFPVIGIVKIGDFSMADRFMYMPICGIFIMFCFGINSLIDRIRFKKILMGIVFVSIGFCYANLTFLQVQNWRDSETLFTHAIAVTKNNFFAHYALGNLYATAGLENNAIYHFLIAVNMCPEKATLWDMLGRAFIMKNLWGRGLKSFRQAALRKPDYPAPYYFEGCVMAATGKYDSAVSYLSKAIELYKGPCRRMADGSVHDADETSKSATADNEDDKAYATGAAGNLIDCKTIVEMSNDYAAHKEYKKAISLFAIPLGRDEIRKRILGGYSAWPLILQSQ